jgi:hypothetical protein
VGEGGPGVGADVATKWQAPTMKGSHKIARERTCWTESFVKLGIRVWYFLTKLRVKILNSYRTYAVGG